MFLLVGLAVHYNKVTTHLEYKDDYQIIRALDLIKGLLVLSGAK